MLIGWDNQLIFASVCTYFWFTLAHTIFSIFFSFSIQLFWSILHWHTCSLRYLSCPFLSLSHTDKRSVSHLLPHTNTCTSLFVTLVGLLFFVWLHGFVSTSCVTRFIGFLCLSSYSILALQIRCVSLRGSETQYTSLDMAKEDKLTAWAQLMNQ